MENYKEDIKKFVKEMTDKYGYLPKYAYNMQNLDNKVFYSGPYYDNEEMEAIIDAGLFGKWASSGEAVRQFELGFSKKINSKHSVMVNSGSSANLIMITGLKKYFNWQDGDEILISAVGFATTYNPVIQNNLKPVFVDIEFDTLNFDLDELEKKITKKTKAIFVSPVLGNPPDIDRLTRIRDSYNIYNGGIQILGDNCDSLGSTWNGKELSEYYVASSCSFFPAHHISTAGQGGMVSTDINELAIIFRQLSSWSRACFPYGTKIYTKEGTKEIQNIVTGDMVLSHTGEFREVRETFQNQFKGKMVSIKCTRKPEITATENHKFFVIRTKDNRLSKYLYKKNGLPDPEWVEAKDIVKGDLLLENVPDNKYKTNVNINYFYHTLFKKEQVSICLNEDLMRLTGYWLAEGSLANTLKGKNGYKENKYYKYRVDFSFNEDETEYIEDVISLMKKCFGVTSFKKFSPRKGKGMSINSTTRKGYEFFNQFCGRGAKNKHIPEWFLYLDNNLLKELVKGFWRGDGSVMCQHMSNRRTAFTMGCISYELIDQIRRILLKMGISAGISTRKPENHTPSFVNGSWIKAKNEFYILNIYGPSAVKMNEILNTKFKDFSSKEKTTFTKNNKYSLFPISEIKYTKTKNTTVYNMSVEEDESYHANGFIAHNCYCQGKNNLLPNGTCGKRFSKWLKSQPDLIIDHRYVFEQIGYNTQPIEIQGAVGLKQLNKIDTIHAKRKEHKTKIQSLFDRYIKGVSFPVVYDQADVSWFGVPIICSSAELKHKLVAYLEKNGIQTRNYFAGNILMHTPYMYLDDWKKYPNANLVLSHVLFVGCAPMYNEKTFQYIEKVLKDFPNE